MSAIDFRNSEKILFDDRIETCIFFKDLASGSAFQSVAKDI